MRLVGEPVLRAFGRKHPPARAPLGRWASVVGMASLRTPAELKRVFPAADFVGDYTVFNIGGNKFRLIAVVLYSLGAIRVAHVLTHAEYSRGKWKE